MYIYVYIRLDFSIRFLSCRLTRVADRFPPPPLRPLFVNPVQKRIGQGCLLCKAGSLCEICALKHVSASTSPSMVVVASGRGSHGSINR